MCYMKCMAAKVEKKILILSIAVKRTSEWLYKSWFEELMDLFDGYTTFYTPDSISMKYFIW